MLIVFSGLPGTGKTTLSRALAARLSATYLRIDTIEQAIRNANVLRGDIGPAGYDVAIAVAETNLGLGRIVIADCVNPVAASRAAWRDAAARADAPVFDIEIVCSDAAIHQCRVEARRRDIAGLVPPSWQTIQRHEYEPWHTARLVVDSATLSPDAALSLIEDYLAGRQA